MQRLSTLDKKDVSKFTDKYLLGIAILIDPGAGRSAW